MRGDGGIAEALLGPAPLQCRIFCLRRDLPPPFPPTADPEKHTLTFALRVDSGRVQNYTVSVQAWTFLTPVQLGIEGAQAHAVSDMMITGLYAGKKETAELVEMVR